MRSGAPAAVGGVICASALAIVTQDAAAGVITLGPFPDYKETIIVNTPIDIDVFIGLQLEIPFDGTISVGKTMRRTIQVPVPTPIFTATYYEVPNPLQHIGEVYRDVFNAADITITDIWALDLNPDGDPFDVALTGFDPINPQMVPLNDQVIVGQDGVEYVADVNAVVTLADLPAFLPGYDLSSISGDDDLIVYVSQTTLPGQAIVPTPGVLGTLAFAGVIALRRSRR